MSKRCKRCESIIDVGDDDMSTYYHNSVLVHLCGTCNDKWGKYYNEIVRSELEKITHNVAIVWHRTWNRHFKCFLAGEKEKVVFI